MIKRRQIKLRQIPAETDAQAFDKCFLESPECEDGICLLRWQCLVDNGLFVVMKITGAKSIDIKYARA